MDLVVLHACLVVSSFVPGKIMDKRSIGGEEKRISCSINWGKRDTLFLQLGV